eukprot:gene35388-45848_t
MRNIRAASVSYCRIAEHIKSSVTISCLRKNSLRRQFLGVALDLTTELRNWKRVLHRPNLPIPESVRMKWLREFYKELLLRRTKVDLIDQLGLKPSIIDTKTLTFSDFEKGVEMVANWMRATRNMDRGATRCLGRNGYTFSTTNKLTVDRNPW